ncbi:lysine--tRNA ligase [Labrys miyagiensis]|uniref:Lysine--tRNA ligase n=1 Tax=Labrys miyagiensis TaxID=346912 RepID=A0ABQ6CIS8_9HYPH|nr:lysine--tRNA ligase [Labrys miyagiensis]GLS18775.1 lysine--tRNA ligase [Labrys miyagiensis]
MSNLFPAELVAAANVSAAWPFEEARKLVTRLQKRAGDKKEILFETGYGPSGLPHIGTFGEVARTSMVRHAFEVLTEGKVPTRLVAFSDDMDGLRKVPGNVPNQALLQANLGKPLTKVPDPFGEYESFAHHNNAMLRRFLDSFGFKYEFLSSTTCYTSGMFDAALLHMLRNIDKVMAVMLPSLREERASTYSPFLPVHPKTGIVMQVPVEESRPEAGTIVWRDPDTGERFETPVTGGHCKLQWKPDWAMRWYALDVDYEMAGKDLIDSVKLSSEIVRALGGTPPDGFNYELFLDERGQKISKTKGNGLSIDEWLTYASPDSLALYMYQKPREAKRLYFDVIPRAVDEYLQFLGGYERQDWKNRLGNPVWHIHTGHPPAPETVGGANQGTSVTFALLLNLVAVANAESKDVLWAFLQRYAPGVSPATHPRLDALVGYAIRYFQDFVKPAKAYAEPTADEKVALERLSEALGNLPDDADAATIQETVYDVGRALPPYQDFKAKGATPERPGVSLEWFNTLYRILLGEQRGPRFGSFAAIYGVPETRQLIAKALSGELVREHQAFLESRKKSS